MWNDLQKNIAKWSDKQFGKNRPPTAPIAHLLKELIELAQDPFNIMEFADCFMLLMDSARMAGFDMAELCLAINEKLKINKKRKWGKPDKNGVVEHIRI